MKSITKILLISTTLVLAACDGNGTVQSGSGHADDSGDTNRSADAGTLPVDALGTPVNPTYGYLPKHCPVQFRPVEPLIGCSTGSFVECACYDPTNPVQYPK